MTYGQERQQVLDTVVAQELQEVIPEAVYGYDGAKAIMPSAMISVLTKAIQELSQQVTDLKAEVELLKE